MYMDPKSADALMKFVDEVVGIHDRAMPAVMLHELAERAIRQPGSCPGIVGFPWKPGNNPQFPRLPYPNCVCGKPLLLYVPPGEVAYPCHVHPERGITGGGLIYCG